MTSFSRVLLCLLFYTRTPALNLAFHPARNPAFRGLFGCVVSCVLPLDPDHHICRIHCLTSLQGQGSKGQGLKPAWGLYSALL